MTYKPGDLLRTTKSRRWGLGDVPTYHGLSEHKDMPAGTIVEYIAIISSGWDDQFIVWVPQYKKYAITDRDKYELVSKHA